MAETASIVKIVGIVVAVVVGLLIALIVFSFASCEYYQYGFAKRKSTGAVDISTVYGSGMYAVGPDMTMKHFQADAHHVVHENVAVYTSDRLEVFITVNFLFFLRKDELPLLHQAYDIYYEPILQKNALDGLKVAATQYSTREFVRDRRRVENMLKKAVTDRLGGKCCTLNCAKTVEGCQSGCKPRQSCTESDKGFFADVEYFYLADVEIPSDVKERFLRALVLQEETETEQFLQDAVVVQKKTEKEVNEILNKAAEISQNATAQSTLLLAQANANATATVEKARSRGLQDLYTRLGLTSQEQKSSFDYLRSLKEMDNVHLSVDFNQLIVGPMKGG